MEALIQTEQTSQSGLVYEAHPTNIIAAAVQRKISDALTAYRKELVLHTETFSHREDNLFPMLVFLRQMGQQNLNGRPKGRMYLDMLRTLSPDIGVDERAPSIIL